MVSIDEIDESQNIDSGIPIAPKTGKKRWCHIAAVCSFDVKTQTQRLEYYRDAQRIEVPIKKG